MNLKFDLLHGNAVDVLKTLPDESVHCCITSPPYLNLRNYKVDGQIGLEKTPKEYIEKLVDVFREVKRVLRNDGTLWIVIGDTYSANRTYQVPQTKDAGTKRDDKTFNYMKSKAPPGLPPKNLLMIPSKLAIALQEDGWILRAFDIWAKGTSGKVRMGNPMPVSIRDRTQSAHEFILMLSKNRKYFYDINSIKEPLKYPNASGIPFGGKKQAGKNGNATYSGNNYYASKLSGGNMRSVWFYTTKPYKGAHMAIFPEALITPMVKAGTSRVGCCSECGSFMFPPKKSSELFWSRKCKCYSKVVPCTVIDPFCGCYDDKTEILTRLGWKTFKDVTTNDEVATLEGGYLTWKHPMAIQRYDYKGNLLHFKSSHIDLLVTPNHNMYVRTHLGKYYYKNNEFEFISADKVRTFAEFKRDAKWNGCKTEYFELPVLENVVGKGRNQHTKINTEEMKIDMNIWCKFFGLYLAEGHTSKNMANISQVIYRNEVENIVSKLPYNYRWSNNDLRIYSKRLANYLKKFGYSQDKYIPEEIKNLSAEYLKSLLEGMVLGDGSEHNNKKPMKYFRYYTVSKRLADDVQEIGIKLGYGVQIKSRKQRSPVKLKDGRIISSKNIQYEVYLSPYHTTPKINKRAKSVYYDGEVFCCTVPSHVILVRRNGKAVWCGNSSTTGVVALKYGCNFIGIDLNKEYLESLSRPRLEKTLDEVKENQKQKKLEV